MKKQIAKSISILSLLVLLSIATVNVSAFPACSTPRCRPDIAVKAAAHNVPPAAAQNLAGQELAFTEPTEEFFSFEFLLARLALSFLFLP